MNYLLKELTKKHSLIFAGGIATAMAAKSVLKSKPVRDFAVKTVAAGMKIQQDAAYELETIREDAKDIVEKENRKENSSDSTDEI